MRWSKLRSLVRQRFAGSIADRVDIQSTRYGNCSCGHAWVTLDGEVVANFCTRAHYIAQGMEPRSSKFGRTPRHQFAEFGELSRQDAYQACWDFVHSLSLEEAISDSDPLVQTLAVLDSRLGKRRLAEIEPARFHPLAAVLLHVRKEAEGLERPKVVALRPTSESVGAE
jgi:hypothetical protein